MKRLWPCAVMLLLAVAATSAPAEEQRPRKARHAAARALLEAARRDPAALEKLLQAGANADTRAASQQTPLAEAAETGNAESIRVLLRHGATVDLPARAKRTPLSLAVRQGRQEAAAVLFTAGADPLAGGPERSAVQVAAAAARDAPMQTLLAAVAGSERERGIREALLVRTAAVGRRDRVTELLDAGVSPDASVFGFTALYNAVEARQPEIVRLLLERGADPDRRIGGKPGPLDLAARQEDLSTVVQLTLAGAKWATAGQHTKARRARIALRGADGAILRALEAAGDIDRRDDEGMTLLMRAAAAGVLDMVQAALAAGAAVDAERHDGSGQSDGWTALMLAAAAGHSPVVGALLTAGASVDHRSREQHTALMVATWYGHTVVAAQLIAAGADASARDRRGQDAKRLARLAGRPELGQVLGVEVPPVPQKEEKPKAKDAPKAGPGAAVPAKDAAKTPAKAVPKNAPAPAAAAKPKPGPQESKP